MKKTRSTKTAAPEGQTADHDQPPLPAPDPRYAPSLRQAAPLLGVTRQRLAYLRSLPGAPAAAADGRIDLPAWRCFLAQHDAESGKLAMTPDRAAALARRTELQAQKIEFDLARARADFIPRTEVVAAWASACAEFARVLTDEIERSLPKAQRGKVRAALVGAFAKIRALGRNF